LRDRALVDIGNYVVVFQGFKILGKVRHCGHLE
jgi:hypothetical protein